MARHALSQRHRPRVWRLGLCCDLHGVERCSIHVQRNAHHGHPRCGRHRRFLAMGRMGSSGPLVEKVRHSNACGPYFRCSQGRVAHASILGCFPRHDHDFQPAGNLRSGLCDSGDCHPGRRDRRAHLQHRPRHPTVRCTRFFSTRQQRRRSTALPRQFRIVVQRPRVERCVRVAGKPRHANGLL